MASLTYFTVTADVLGIIGDGGDVGVNPDTVAARGKITFTPMINDGDALQLTTLSPRPAIGALQPIDAVIDTDGQMKYRGEVGVRLVANTAVLGLATPLFYRVAFSDVTVNGVALTLTGFNFQAAQSDTTINLASVAHVPGQPAQGITKGDPGQDLRIDGVAATYGALPGSAPDGEVWLVQADGKLYVRAGGAWPTNGDGISLQGDPGPPGVDGAPGAPGANGANGANGVDGQPQGMYATTIGNGALTTITVTHNLGTKDLIVGFRLVSTDEVVDVDPLTFLDNNSFSVTFAGAPALNSIRVVVIGGAMAVVAGDIDGGAL